MSDELNDALTAAIRDPECPVQYTPVLMQVKRTLGKQASENERLRAALEEIVQHAELGTPPWVLIPDHLIGRAKLALNQQSQEQKP